MFQSRRNAESSERFSELEILLCIYTNSLSLLLLLLFSFFFFLRLFSFFNARRVLHEKPSSFPPSLAALFLFAFSEGLLTKLYLEREICCYFSILAAPSLFSHFWPKEETRFSLSFILKQTANETRHKTSFICLYERTS